MFWAYTKGIFKSLTGTMQQKFGQLTGDRIQQVKGMAKQQDGRLQKRRSMLPQTPSKFRLRLVS